MRVIIIWFVLSGSLYDSYYNDFLSKKVPGLDKNLIIKSSASKKKLWARSSWQQLPLATLLPFARVLYFNVETLPFARITIRNTVTIRQVLRDWHHRPIFIALKSLQFASFPFPANPSSCQFARHKGSQVFKPIKSKHFNFPRFSKLIYSLQNFITLMMRN